MMWKDDPYYHGTIKKAVIAFGNLFDGIYINSQDAAGKPQRVIKCPISFAPKEQWYYRLKEDPDFKNKFEVDLPRLSFEISNIQYFPEKNLGNAVNSFLKSCGGDQAKAYVPVSYRLTFQLSSYCKNQEDSLQILEQILPYFRPALNITLLLIPELNFSLSIPITLSSVEHEDNYQDLTTNRMIIQTFTFNMDVMLFGPTVSDDKIVRIKEAIVNVTTNNTNAVEETYDAVVNPRTAEKDEPYTIDEMWTPL
jgi:hypothetical protein